MHFFRILIVRTLAPAPHQKSADSLAFRSALLFAQEYGILAASAEDRPFVPTSSVVICAKNASENIAQTSMPEGLTRSFRKWDEGVIREHRDVPLTVALEGLVEQR